MSKLATIHLFRDLDDQTLATLESGLRTRRLAPGETIFREGDPGDGLYAVLDGSVYLSILMNQSHRSVLARVGEGEIFGEMAVLDGQPRSATAQAETAATVGFIDRAAFLDALQRSPGLAVGLLHEISGRLRRFTRRHVEEALKAERLNLLGSCVRSIVHDLRNPLSTIRIAVQLAGREGTSPETKRRACEQIDRQVTRLDGMTKELLEFTRGTRVDANLAPIDYAAFLQALVAELRAEVAPRRIEVDLRVGATPLQVRIDPKRLSHLFYNLLDNAAAAMAEGGKVVIEAGAEEGRVVTRIRDTGHGIAPEVAGRLFEPFVSFGKPDGTGLGLAICNKIVADHGGTIAAENTAEGGASFRFTLPFVAPPGGEKTQSAPGVQDPGPGAIEGTPPASTGG